MREKERRTEGETGVHRMVYRRRKEFTFHISIRRNHSSSLPQFAFLLDLFPKIAFDLSPSTFVFSCLSLTFAHSASESKVALSANTVSVTPASTPGELVSPAANFSSIFLRGLSFAVSLSSGPCSVQRRGLTFVGLVKAKLVMALSTIACIAVLITVLSAVHLPSPCRYWRTWVMLVGLGRASPVCSFHAEPPVPALDLASALTALCRMVPNLSLDASAALLSSGVKASSRKAAVEASLWESSVARWGASGARAMALAWWVKVRAARAAERKRVVRILGEGVGDESLGFFLL